MLLWAVRSVVCHMGTKDTFPASLLAHFLWLLFKFPTFGESNVQLPFYLANIPEHHIAVPRKPNSSDFWGFIFLHSVQGYYLSLSQHGLLAHHSCHMNVKCTL